MAHRLDPLLRPGSIALVGASGRPDSPGRVLADMVINSAWRGAVYPINPGYESLFGVRCYPDLDSLPETVEHAALAVSNERLEQALRDAIRHGVRAVTIYSSCILENDTEPPLRQRLSELAKQAGIAICGGNGMGFYNISDALYAGLFPMNRNRHHELPGGISFIAQSGSAFAALAHNGCRLKFNLCVSCGNEMVTTVADYMDWSLSRPDTRVIALFLETVREPKAFTDALERAMQQDIPVIVMKAGKSPLGARMAKTHTGAIAGNHAAYEAVFDHYNVIEVSDFNEMGATLMMFQSGRRAGAGDLATIQESGGLMELVADIACDLGIRFAPISENTKAALRENLEPGLIADNPLDAWGSNHDFENRFYRCMSAMMRDPAVSVGLFFSNFRDHYYLSEAFYRLMVKVAGETDKPVAMANCHTDIDNPDLCKRTGEAGIPFLDGTRPSLLAVKRLLTYRNRRKDPAAATPTDLPDTGKVTKWKQLLSGHTGTTLSEWQALELFADFGISTPRCRGAQNRDEALRAASELGFPLVLKTAAGGVAHKSDQNGVITGITNAKELEQAYETLSQRLGNRVLVSEMAAPGTEVGLGMVNDPQFGPFIMVAAGGVLIELISDSQVALAPVTPARAEQMIASLKIARLIDGMRGNPPGDRRALIETIVRLSGLAFALREVISEIDINPVIVNQAGAWAVDGLVSVFDSSQASSNLSNRETTCA